MRRFVLALVGVAACATALRLPYLTGRSLWYDEASSWQTASFPLSELMGSVRLNVHLPLYYVLLKGWMAALGDSVAALRGFSIALGVLTVVAMGLLGRELALASGALDPADESGGRRFGIFLAALAAASPFQVYASIEARMYSLGTALSALGAWLLLLILRRGGRSLLWWAYGASSAALLYVHHYALFTVAAQFLFLALYGAWLLGVGDREGLRAVWGRAAIVGLALAVIYLPGLDLVQAQTRRVQQDYWIEPLSWKVVAATFADFVVTGADDPAREPWGWAVLAVVAGSCLVVASRCRRGDGLMLASALTPPLLAAAVSTVQPIWVARYFRFAHLFLLAVVATAIWRITRRSPAARAALVGLTLAGLLAGDIAFWRSLDIPNNPGPRGAVEAAIAGSEPGEAIVALDLFQYFPAKYYARGRARVRLLRPAIDTFWGGHLIRPDDLIDPEELGRELARGVWVIGKEPTGTATTVQELRGVPFDRQWIFTYYDYLHKRVVVRHYAGTAGAPALEGDRP
jgi:mannosyltransferase